MSKHFGLILFGLLILASCSSEKVRVTPLVKYTMPTGYESVSYEIEQRDGYPMDTYVIENNETATDLQETWQTWNSNREEAAKYLMLRHLYDNENDKTFAESEEIRIDKYCKDYGFTRCRTISMTCEKEGCHAVTVTCDDDNYDASIDDYDECHRFEVKVDDEIDDTLTADSDEEVCDGGSSI